MIAEGLLDVGRSAGFEARVRIHVAAHSSMLEPILAPFGVAQAQFFTNAIDTRTEGLDIVAASDDPQSLADAFADALAMHPLLFDPLYVNMVRAGEASGKLADYIPQLARVDPRRFDAVMSDEAMPGLTGSERSPTCSRRPAAAASSRRACAIPTAWPGTPRRANCGPQ